MDPYQLFSTPPADQMLSSTPLKQRAPKTYTPAKAKGANGKPKTPPPAKISINNKLNRSSTSLCTPNAIRKRQTNKSKRQAKKENLWEKHLKNNPELAQFVDQFNHSLEEATSKPLDMS